MSPRYLQLGNDGERLLGELLSWENAPERITLLGELSWEKCSPGRMLLGLIYATYIYKYTPFPLLASRNQAVLAKLLLHICLLQPENC